MSSRAPDIMSYNASINYIWMPLLTWPQWSYLFGRQRPVPRFGFRFGELPARQRGTCEGSSGSGPFRPPHGAPCSSHVRLVTGKQNAIPIEVLRRPIAMPPHDVYSTPLTATHARLMTAIVTHQCAKEMVEDICNSNVPVTLFRL